MESSACDSEVCLTCSDLATAVKVLEIRDSMALVDTGQGTSEVCLDLVDANVGDTVLIHAGVALRTLPPSPGI